MNKIECVDIYDRNKNKTGIKKIRHVDTYEDGEYIIGVQLVLFNKNNEILITKRSDTKEVIPGKWECNGGAIVAGETPIEGLEREIREELGIDLDRNKIVFYKSVIDDNRHNIKDIFIYKDDIDINSLNYSNDEVSAAKYVSIDKYMDMFNSGDIVYNVDFNDEDYNKAIKMI